MIWCAVRSGVGVALVALMVSAPAFAQILENQPASNTDPVRCFDHVLRDAQNAVQAYQIVYAAGWTDEVSCRGQALAAPEFEPCWASVMQARPLIEQAAGLYERARRTPAAAQGQLVSQANALMKQANGLLQNAQSCFQPVMARWQQNGGHYVPGDRFDVTSPPSTENTPGAPPGLPPYIPPTLPPGIPPGLPPASPPGLPVPGPEGPVASPHPTQPGGPRTGDGHWTGIVEHCHGTPGAGTGPGVEIGGPGGIIGPVCIRCEWTNRSGSQRTSKYIQAPGYVLEAYKQPRAYERSTAVERACGGTGPSQPVAPGTACVKVPYDVRSDVPGADPSLRYTIGFERGFAGCLESQINIENLAAAALAARFKQIAAILLVVAVPGVIDGVLHPPGASADPNPFLRGETEGQRLCEWGLKMAPALVARCLAGEGSPGQRGVCTVDEAMNGYGAAFGAAAANASKRFDCFPCTLAWLRGEAYVPPAGGGQPWALESIIGTLKQTYGSLTPQGPPLPCWRQAAQTKGIPGSMTQVGIEAEMSVAGDGAKGLVFRLDPRDSHGHVFAVRTIGSGPSARVEFWDPQQRMDGKMWFSGGGPSVWYTLYRIQ